MDGDSKLLLLYFILFWIMILLCAFFAGAETALTTFKRTKLKAEANENPKVLEFLKHWLKRPNEILITLLLGTNVVITLATAIITKVTDSFMSQMHITSELYAIVIPSFIVTIILLIFGEITPKIIARNHSEKISKAVILPIYYLSIIVTPVVWLFSFVSIMISRILGIKIRSDEGLLITEEDIKTFVAVGEEEGVIEEEEKKMIHSIFEFGDSLVGDVMIPRTDVFAIEGSSLLSSMWDKILENGYSRIPIYENEIDNIIGIAYLKDLINLSRKNGDDFPIKDGVREAVFVPETKHSFDLLKEFRETKVHLAIVIDEYGGTLGIITIEDLLEEIVGEINDEYDDEESKVSKLSDNEFIINPTIEIETLNETLKIEIPESDEYDTLAGYVFYKLGRVPDKGEIIETDEFVLIISSVEKNRILEIIIKKR